MVNQKKSNDLGILLRGVGIGHLSNQPEVIVIPTDFVGFNRATRIGGVPVSCVMMVYGPSQGGKTAFMLGLVKSFQQRGHLACYIDAEHTLDVPWAVSCGIDPSLPYDRPDTYEITRTKVNRMIKNFISGRDKGHYHPSKALLIVVDSLNKLVPESEANKKELKKAYPLRALFNTIWLDQITPIIHKYPILFALVAHEKEKMDTGQWEDAKKHKGGSALYYDSSMVINISTRKVIRQEDKKTKRKVEVGILHEGKVEKNKLGVCHETFQFIMSTGRGAQPIGFDTIREVMEEAKLRDKRSPLYRCVGGVWTFDEFPDGKIKGDADVRAYLRETPDVLQSIIDKMNASALDTLETEGEDEEEENDSQ